MSGHTEGFMGFDSNGEPVDCWGFYSTCASMEDDYGRNIDWLVDDVIAQGRFAIYGLPESQKSFFALTLAHHLVLGLPFLGHRTEQSNVLYVAAEDPGQFGPRLRAFRKANGLHRPPEGLLFREGPFDLLDGRDVDRLIEDIWKFKKANKGLPDVIIIDPFADCFNGEENTGEDVGRAMASLKRIMRSSSVHSVGIVHHTGKDGDDERGHSRLRGAMTTMLKIRAISPDELKIDVTKQRNGSKLQFTVRSSVIQLSGQLTSRALSCTTAEQSTTVSAQGVRVAENTTTALHALQTFGPKGSNRSAWREASGLKGGTFDRAASILLKNGKVTKRDRRYFAYDVR